MLGLDWRAFRIAWTVFILAGLLALLYLVRQVLLVFVLAVLFAYVVWPLVAGVERLLRVRVASGRVARLSALGLVYVVLVTGAILAGTLIVPRIADQGATLVEKGTIFVRKIESGELLVEMSRARGWSLPALYKAQEQLVRHAGSIVPYLQSAGRELLHYLSNLWLVVLVPILAFFLLKDAESLVGGVEGSITAREHRDLLRDIFTDLHDLLAHYMRALILLSLMSFGSHLLFFLIAGVPYTLLLATLAGLLEFIPMVGPLTAASVILLAAWMAGYSHVVWILIFLGAWRIVQDYVNMPWLMGSGVELHPLLVIFGILAGAELGGVAGMFLSIPVMAAVRILVRRAMREARAAEARALG